MESMCEPGAALPPTRPPTRPSRVDVALRTWTKSGEGDIPEHASTDVCGMLPRVERGGSLARVAAVKGD